MQAQTASEIRGSILTGSELVPYSSLPDPYNWCDLLEQKNSATKLVQHRISNGLTPRAAQVIKWPKESGGWRPMVWFDPLDQVVFRGVVGRLIPGIRRHIGDNVLSSRLAHDPPKWRLEKWGAQTQERTQRGLELLNNRPVLGIIDIKNFFPSIELDVLERILGGMSLEPRGFTFLLDWLRGLETAYSAPGLPTGHDPSRMLADGLLVGCDAALEEMGVPFLRYVDDTWCFVRSDDEFDAVVTRYVESLSSIGLEIHPEKTRFLVGDEAANEIQNFAIAYLDDDLREPGDEGLAASLGLFEFALEELPERKSELRRALTAFKIHKTLQPLKELQENLELLRYAPDHWARYLRVLGSQKDTRRALDGDWMVEQVLSHASKKDETYKSLVFLRALEKLHLGPELGDQIGGLVTKTEGWLAPVRVWSAHVWGSSQAFRPPLAIEYLEASGDYPTKRSLAMTFDSRRTHKKQAAWLERIRRLDSELEPTVRWLEN